MIGRRSGRIYHRKGGFLDLIATKTLQIQPVYFARCTPALAVAPLLEDHLAPAIRQVHVDRALRAPDPVVLRVPLLLGIRGPAVPGRAMRGGIRS